MSRKSPAQLLFERIIRTWIVPEAARRQKTNPEQGPIPLRAVLIVWDEGMEKPSVYVNQELEGRVERADVVASRPIAQGEIITAEDIKGLRRIQLHRQHWGQTYIFICQGMGQRYYLTYGKIGHLKEKLEFTRLKNALRTEGLQLTNSNVHMPVIMDLIRNSYVGDARAKRRFFIQLKKVREQQHRERTSGEVRRHLQLPAYIAHFDNEVYPLLEEARRTYVGGNFFSCVAASATAADRLCMGLSERYGIDRRTLKFLTESTLGQKVERLKSLRLIDDAQLGALIRLNTIRNRHIHPGRPVSSRATRTDALKSLRLLHEFLEGTLSIFSDYAIEDGVFVPRPISW